MSSSRSGTVEAGEFLDCGFAAAFQAGDFTEPAVEFGFFDAFGEVRDDFNDAFTLFGVDSQHWASDAGVFMLTGRSIGSAAGAQFEFAFVEVLAELGPFFVGRFPVFDFRSDASSFVDVRPVGADHLIGKDGKIVLCCFETGMAEYFGGDMHGQTARHRFGGKHPAEIMRTEPHRFTGSVGGSSVGHCQVEESVNLLERQYVIAGLLVTEPLEKVR